MPTLVTKTVKSSGGDYSSLAAWEAAQQGDLVAGDTLQQAECYGFLDSGAVTIAGSTVDSTRYMRILAAVGAEAQTPWNTTTSYRLRGSFCPLTVNQSYTRVERIQLETNIDDTNLTGVQIDRAAVDVLVRGCHIRSGVLGAYTFGGTSHGIDGGTDALGNRYLINNIIDWGNGFASGASNVVGIQTTSHDAGNTFVYNCTIIGGTATGAKGIHDSYSKILCKNVIATGHLGGDFSSINSGNAANCASGDVSAVGAGARISQTFTFVGAGDYHLDATDIGAKDFGTDLSADASYPFVDDFDGVVRSGTWDIGADEFVSGISVAPPGRFDPLFQTPIATMLGPWGLVAEQQRVLGSTFIPDVPAGLGLGDILSENPLPTTMTGPWGRVAQTVRTMGSTVIPLSNTVDLTSGQVRSFAVLPGASLLQTIPLSSGNVRELERLLGAALVQAQPLSATPIRDIERVPSSVITLLTALSGTIRGWERLNGAILLQNQVLLGQIRALERVSGAILAQAQSLAGMIRHSQRLTGAPLLSTLPLSATPVRAWERVMGPAVLVGAISLSGIIRSWTRIPGASLPSTLALVGAPIRIVERVRTASLFQTLILTGGSSREIERLLGAPLFQTLPLAGRIRALERLRGAMLLAIIAEWINTGPLDPASPFSIIVVANPRAIITPTVTIERISPALLNAIITHLEDAT